jgi:DNA-directed RNA polymerase beta' subunit
MSKQTAVQQLINRLKRDIDYLNSLLNQQIYTEMKISILAKISQTEHILKYTEKMLDEERNQIEDAFYNGTNLYNNWHEVEQYYNETYRGDINSEI